MPDNKGEPLKGNEPSADVEASNQSTVEDVAVSRGAARVKALDRSGVKGINVGKSVSKDPRGWRWWLEKVVIPIFGIILAAVLAWYFGLKKK